MITHALIQKLPDGSFASPNSYIAWQGFHDRGLPTSFFQYPDLRAGKVPLSPTTIVVGGAAAVTAATRAGGADPPAAYPLDPARTDDRRTLLVEVNDAYSLGALGLKPLPYSLLLQTRWEQLAAS